MEAQPSSTKWLGSWSDLDAVSTLAFKKAFAPDVDLGYDHWFLVLVLILVFFFWMINTLAAYDYAWYRGGYTKVHARTLETQKSSIRHKEIAFQQRKNL